MSTVTRDIRQTETWINGISKCKYNDFKNKQESVDYYVNYMLTRTQSIFKYDGLPDTIPQRTIELYLQCNGNCLFAEHDGNYYVFVGGMGGILDYNYMPTEYIVANPYLKLNRVYKINVDSVVIPNDTMYMGLLPMFSRYSSLLADNDISLRIATINSRIVSILNALNDSDKKAAELYMQHIENGDLSVIGSNIVTNGVTTSPYATSGSKVLTDLIEERQYLRACMYNDIGLNSNYNMKRESLNSVEGQMNADCLIPFIDDMLQCRQTAIEKINNMFGLNISVELNSVWAVKDAELDAELDAAENPENSENVDNRVDNVDNSENEEDLGNENQ